MAVLLARTSVADSFIRYFSSYTKSGYSFFCLFGTYFEVLSDLGLRMTAQMLMGLSNLIWGKGMLLLILSLFQILKYAGLHLAESGKLE